MAISISISNISTTSATLNIQGLNTERRTKQLLMWINGEFINVPGGFYATGSSYSTNLNNLSPYTFYSIDIEVDYYDPTADDYFYQGYDSTSFTTRAITVTQYSVSVNNNEVTITINSFPNNSFANFYLYNEDKTQIIYSYNDTLYRNYHTFSNVANGNYNVAVDYQNVNTGIPTTVYHQSDEQEFYLITISGSGPSPSGNWHYDSISLYTSTARTTSYSNLSAKEGYVFAFTFDTAGTLEVYSSQSYGSLKSYISTINNEYDPLSGEPYSCTGSDIGAFNYTYIGNRNEIFYVWVNSPTDNYSYTLNINFIPVTSTYTISQSNNSITVSINNAGTGFNFDPYIYYGPNRTGGVYTSGHAAALNSITFSNISNGTYYLWVQYRDNTFPANVWVWIKNNLINQQETSFTVGTPTVDTPTFVAQVINTKQIKFTVSNGGNYFFKYCVYDNQNNSVFDYFRDYGSYTSSTEFTVPSNYLSYNTSYLVKVSYAQSNNGLNAQQIGNGQQLQTGLEPISNNYIYIFNGTQWKKAIPYIFNGTQWKQAQAYIFNGSQWKKCGQ